MIFSGPVFYCRLGCSPSVVPGLFDFVGGPVFERRVKPFLIVPQFDVACDVFHRVFAGRVDGAVHPFHLERGIKRFRPRIIITNTGPADRTGDADTGGELGELARRVLGASVGTKPNSA